MANITRFIYDYWAISTAGVPRKKKSIRYNSHAAYQLKVSTDNMKRIMTSYICITYRAHDVAIPAKELVLVDRYRLVVEI